MTSLHGMDVFLSTFLPREHVGDEIKPIWPHPFVAWVERLLGRPRCPVMFVRGAKIEHDLAFRLGNKLFVPPSMMYALKNMPPDHGDNLMRGFRP